MFTETELKIITSHGHFKDMIQTLKIRDMDTFRPNDGNFCNMVICPKSGSNCTVCKEYYRQLLKKHLMQVKKLR